MDPPCRTADDAAARADDAGAGWLMSVLFWLVLLAAAALYAAVALSPRLLAFFDLRQTYHRNQVRLVTLERQAQSLQRVIDALEHDPEFAAQMARIDFDAVRPGDERIAVEAPLTLAGRPPEPPPAVPDALPWYALPLQPFALEQRVRTWALAAAALMTLLAFTFLQESGVSERSTASGVRTGLTRLLARRYRSSVQPSSRGPTGRA